MSKMKHVFFAIMLFVLLLAISGSAFAAETGTCGEHLTWVLDDNGTLTISGFGPMDDFGWKDRPWNANVIDMESVKQIVIEEGVTSIGNFAFGDSMGEGMFSVASVSLPGTLQKIGCNAFEGCAVLKTIELPYGLEYIGSSAFYNCTGLQSINLPASVTTLGDNAFQDCYSLKSAVLSDGMTEIGYSVFEGCQMLRSVTLPENLKSIGARAFFECTGLSSIHFPNNLKSIGEEAFLSCDFDKLVLPDSVTTIGRLAFFSNAFLEYLVLPKNLTFIGEMAFDECGLFTENEILTDVYYPNDRIHASRIKMDNTAFPYGIRWHYATSGDCGEQLTWNIDSLGQLNITGNGEMDAYTKNLQPWVPSAFSVVTIQEGVTSLSDYAFQDAKVTALYLPESLATFGDNIINGCKPTVYCYEFTNADYWAYSLGLPVVYLDDLTFDDYGSVTVTAEESTLYRGEKCQLNVTLVPEMPGISIAWSTSDAAVATVDANGVVTTHTRGSAVITASVGSVQDCVNITVNGFYDVGELTIAGAPKYLEVGDSWQAVVTAAPNDSSLVYRWHSSDTNVLTVSESGLVTAVGKGTAQITVEAEGVTAASSQVYAYIPVKSISIQPEFWGVAKSTVQLKWDYEPANANPVLKWSSEHSAHAAVTFDAQGIVGCFVPGDITITMVDEITGVSASTIVHICRPVKAIEMEETLTFGSCRTSYQLEAVAMTADNRYVNHLLVYSSDDDSIASVTPDGLLTVLSPGVVHITVAAESGTTAVCEVTILKEPHARKTVIDAHAPTCAAEGNTKYYICDFCGEFLAQENDEYVSIAEGSWIIPKVGIHHVDQYICSVCGQKFSSDGLNTMVLPADLVCIQEGAFTGTSMQWITVPDGCIVIDVNAFSACENLQYIDLPDTFSSLASVLVRPEVQIILRSVKMN